MIFSREILAVPAGKTLVFNLRADRRTATLA
jgi:hypothetical protein